MRDPSDLVHSSSNSSVSGALCGYFWHVRKDRGSTPHLPSRTFPDRNALPAQTRHCVCTGCPVVKETSYFHLDTCAGSESLPEQRFSGTEASPRTTRFR